MGWTRERAALIVCGVSVGAFINLWIVLVSPWAGLFISCLIGIAGMYLLTSGLNE